MTQEIEYFECDERDGGVPAPLFGSAQSPCAQVGTGSACRVVHPGDSPDRALRALHETYAQRIFAYAYSMLRNREDAEDAVQTTFMNAYGSLRDGRVPQQEAAWLFRIARNVCLNRIRSHQRKPVASTEGLAIAGTISVEDVLEQRLHVRALRLALERLPEQQRKAIVMRELQGATYAEIADALDTTQGAVESLIFRARRQLAGALTPVVAGTAPLGAAA
jgi:RNA polymerase sigma factor (sigma-70 family)